MITLATPYGEAHFVETDADAAQAVAWILCQRAIAVDTETTGLDIFAATHSVRLVQFGSETVAYLFNAELWRDAVIEALAGLIANDSTIVMHNAPYDIMCLDIGGFVDRGALLWILTTFAQAPTI